MNERKNNNLEELIDDCQTLVKNITKETNGSLLVELKKTKIFTSRNVKDPYSWYAIWREIFKIVDKEC